MNENDSLLNVTDEIGIENVEPTPKKASKKSKRSGNAEVLEPVVTLGASKTPTSNGANTEVRNVVSLPV